MNGLSDGCPHPHTCAAPEVEEEPGAKPSTGRAAAPTAMQWEGYTGTVGNTGGEPTEVGRSADPGL